MEDREQSPAAPTPPEGGSAASAGQSTAGKVAGWVAGFLALIVVNVMGQGAAIADSTFVTGFVVGGGAFFVVSLVVDLIVRAGASRG